MAWAVDTKASPSSHPRRRGNRLVFERRTAIAVLLYICIRVAGGWGCLPGDMQTKSNVAPLILCIGYCFMAYPMLGRIEYTHRYFSAPRLRFYDSGNEGVGPAREPLDWEDCQPRLRHNRLTKPGSVFR